MAGGFFEDWDATQDRAYLKTKVGTILGGVPNHQDLIPSIMCVVMYSILFVPISWRLYNRTLTIHQVWRPLIVIMTRISSFAIRIKLAEGYNWNKDLFVAEIILLRLSPILLTSALISLFREALLPYLPLKDSPNPKLKVLFKYAISCLQFATYFCLGLTIAIAFDVKQAINGNKDARVKLHRSKEISIYLLLVVNSLVYFISIVPFTMIHQVVVAGYKTAQLASSGKSNRVEVVINKKLLFYGICVAGEYIACSLFAFLPWNNIVPSKKKLYTLSEANEGLTPESFRPTSVGAVVGDQQCPTYTQQMVNGIATQQTSPQHVLPGRAMYPDGVGGLSFTGNYTPSLYIPNKRGSTNTLSTISEVDSLEMEEEKKHFAQHHSI